MSKDLDGLEVIVTHPSGALAIACDGRHDFPYHIFYFYSVEEAIRIWGWEHD